LSSEMKYINLRLDDNDYERLEILAGELKNSLAGTLRYLIYRATDGKTAEELAEGSVDGN